MIQVDTKVLQENARVVLSACRKYGVQLAAVTKMFGGRPEIAQILLDAGVEMLADARIKNLARLPQSKPRMLLRITDPEQAEEVVKNCEYSLQSTPEAIVALGQVAHKLCKPHQVVLMVDLGDLREGIYYQDKKRMMEMVALILKQENLNLAGLGTNLTCFGGILPDEENMAQLLHLAQEIRTYYQIPLPLVSGGNSSSLHLLLNGRLPVGINHLRVGEGLLLGMDTASGKPFRQLSQDAFTQFARLVEVYAKPSKPAGKAGPNAFGEEVFFKDHGPMLRGVLAIGRQDTDHEGLFPLDERVKVLGASSDHLLVDLTQAPEYRVGDVLGFRPSYGALLKAYTSPYVEKRRHDKKGRMVMQSKSCCHTIDKRAARQIDTNSAYLVFNEDEKENERVREPLI
jgi:predicted amino acid racemase